jgi:hypothetical protein
MTKRDDFRAKTKRTLEARVGHKCSNPGCQRPTSGPAAAENKAVSVGKAAHITAAAINGPRYDSSLSPEERRAETNGIWLCSLCADLIDTDEKRFPEDLIRQWKQGAVERALKDIVTLPAGAYRRPAVTIELDDDDRSFLQALALPDDDVDVIVERMRAAALRDIDAFRRMKEWPAHAIPLGLTLNAGETRLPVSVEGMANAANLGEFINLVSGPGTGKTTTLVQLTDAILAAGAMVALLIPLGEWSDRREDFFTSLTQRGAFGAFRRQHFVHLAYHGRLVLLLDGWNELDPAARVAALRRLNALRREYPLLAVVVGTRRNLVEIPGPVVEISPLSESQQHGLAFALRGAEGVALLDQAWRQPGVRELVSIPLYLTALLIGTRGGRLPQTKEEVLRLFVRQHEQAPDKAELLQKELFNCHGDILTGLAAEANRAANTVLTDTGARAVISSVETGLCASGQLSVPPQPATVIEVLVNGHILVRSAPGGGISFQHQQFQEWYASFEVERLMRGSAAGNRDARSHLRERVLNLPAWEESTLFACERLSRQGEVGARVVSATIREALAIDPMLAAEMIFRSASEVWTEVGPDAMTFATRWHVAGRDDRAARFMMTTGKPDFAAQIWPLIASPDDQVQLTALRLPRRFRPAVLGAGVEAKIAALPEAIRGHAVAEIASNSGFDGMELAATIAKSEPNAKVVVGVLQALQFRQADRLVGEIMRAANDDVWKAVASAGYPDELADPDQNARLIGLREAQYAAATDPVQVLINATRRRG